MSVTSRILGKKFTPKEMYVFKDRLRKLHPENKHVKDKIRQQMPRGCGVCEEREISIKINIYLPS